VASARGYLTDPESPELRKLAAERPEIVLIGVASDREKLLRTLENLKAAIPEAKLFVAVPGGETHLIIEAMRAGAGEFLEAPVSTPDIEEALARHISREAKQGGLRARGSLYSIISGKLSTGATTVAINVANTIAAATEASTLLIDLDMPLGDAAAYLNLRPQYTVQDALHAANRLDPMLLENFTVKVKNTTLNILGGFREYTARSAVTPPALDTILRVSRQAFRYTVVDLSGSIDSDQAVVLARQSDQILITLTPDLPAIWRTEKLLTFLAHHGAADNVRLILNRTSRRDDIVERDIERLLSQPVYHALPNDYGACLKAINSGRPLQPEDSRSLHHSIQQLALRMAGIPNPKESRGLLGMFLRPTSIGG
jgi:pilus assembly protein CpaE